jgi:hypothetical protein
VTAIRPSFPLPILLYTSFDLPICILSYIKCSYIPQSYDLSTVNFFSVQGFSSCLFIPLPFKTFFLPTLLFLAFQT